MQAWYAGNCDGEWEHGYGVEINTLDNPGWRVRIDLIGTRWEKLASPRRFLERTETDRVDVGIEGGQFRGAGGPFNLEEIIREFFRLVA